MAARHPDSPGLPAEIKFIDALIPRCTFVDHASGLTADITAGPALLHRPGSAPLQHSGEIASAYVRDLIGQYAPLRPLVLILKALLRRAHYHEPFIGGLSSHGLVMMVGTMLRVREIESGSDALHATPLSVLLCEFLFVFGFEFDYAKYGISLKRGEFFDRLNLGDFAAPLLVEVCGARESACACVRARLHEACARVCVRVCVLGGEGRKDEAARQQQQEEAAGRAGRRARCARPVRVLRHALALATLTPHHGACARAAHRSIGRRTRSQRHLRMGRW